MPDMLENLDPIRRPLDGAKRRRAANAAAIRAVADRKPRRVLPRDLDQSDVERDARAARDAYEGISIEDDIAESNAAAERERAQERAAYEAEMREEEGVTPRYTERGPVCGHCSSGWGRNRLQVRHANAAEVKRCMQVQARNAAEHAAELADERRLERAYEERGSDDGFNEWEAQRGVM